MSHPERFPIMSKVVPSVPWAMLAPHEAQAVKNHDQSLKVLASRGGLDPSEALWVLDGISLRDGISSLPAGRGERARHDLRDAQELKRRVEAWEATA